MVLVAANFTDCSWKVRVDGEENMGKAFIYWRDESPAKYTKDVTALSLTQFPSILC